MVLFAQEEVVKHSVQLDASGVTVADIGDGRDGDGASADQGRCLGVSCG